jgi:hypothetical protein
MTTADMFIEALTPSGETKAAYIGEFSFTVMQVQEDEDGEAVEVPVKVYVPWTTIKEIMAVILKRANEAEDKPCRQCGITGAHLPYCTANPAYRAGDWN